MQEDSAATTEAPLGNFPSILSKIIYRRVGSNVE